MSDKETVEMLVKEIHDRFDAIEESVSEEKIRAMVNETLTDLAEDEEFVRKIRFGTEETPKKIVGSKFARWGLDISDVEFLYDLQNAMIGMRKVSSDGVYKGPSEELENTFETISEAIYIDQEKVKEMDRVALDDMFPRIPKSLFHGPDKLHAERGEYQLTEAYKRALRAMDTAESGYGSQLVGAQYVGELWEGARPQSRVFALLPTFEMTAPTAYLPVEAAPPEMLFVSEATSPTASAYTTSKVGSNRVQVDAKKFIISMIWSGEMEEDSIIPFIPFIRAQAQKSLAHYSDSVVLNGDTTNAATGNINLDDADPADTKHYLAFDGMRHVGIVDNTNNASNLSGVITLDALKDAKGRMIDSTYLMDWGHPVDPYDLVFIADPETADEIATLDDVIMWNQIQGRPILVGMTALALGHPVIGSIAMSKTEADGKVSTTGSNNTLGQVLTVHRGGFTVGWRRRIKLETDRLPERDQSRMVFSLRIGLGRYSPTGAASGIEAADVIYNISI